MKVACREIFTVLCLLAASILIPSDAFSSWVQIGLEVCRYILNVVAGLSQAHAYVGTARWVRANFTVVLSFLTPVGKRDPSDRLYPEVSSVSFSDEAKGSPSYR